MKNRKKRDNSAILNENKYSNRLYNGSLHVNHNLGVIPYVWRHFKATEMGFGIFKDFPRCERRTGVAVEVRSAGYSLSRNLLAGNDVISSGVPIFLSDVCLLNIINLPVYYPDGFQCYLLEKNYRKIIQWQFSLIRARFMIRKML